MVSTIIVKQTHITEVYGENLIEVDYLDIWKNLAANFQIYMTKSDNRTFLNLTEIHWLFVQLSPSESTSKYLFSSFGTLNTFWKSFPFELIHLINNL